MLGSSSSSSTRDKSPVIHSNVTETIIHTYADVINNVNEEIFDRFHTILIKTPVVFVDRKIPSDVLNWYKTYVFGQAREKVEPVFKVPAVKELAKESIVTDKVEVTLKKDSKKQIIEARKPSNENVIVAVVTATQNEEICDMDIEVAEEALEDIPNLEVNQSVSILSEESINDDSSYNVNITIDSNIINSNPIVTKETNQMDFEVNNQPVEEMSKPMFDQSVSQPVIMVQPKSKIESNLQLSEESSNESTNMDKIEDVNENLMENLDDETMKNLLSDVMAAIEAEKKENNDMEIDEAAQLEELESLLKSNKEINQSCEEESHEEEKSQSNLRLSEESSNDSISADKKDEENNDKMRNIKSNSNVFSALEDENNLLDFEDI